MFQEAIWGEKTMTKTARRQKYVVSFPTEESLFRVIKQAWDWIWKNKGNKTFSYRGQEHYTTAQDIMRRVRASLCEKGNKAKEGEYGLDDWHLPLTVRLPKTTWSQRSTDLRTYVRGWLSDQERKGKIESHAFGTRTSSGRRYRPKGAPISKAEEKTLSKTREERARTNRGVRHLGWEAVPLPTTKNIVVGVIGPVCGAKFSTSTFSRHRRRGTMTFTEPESISCKKCLNKTIKLYLEHYKIPGYDPVIAGDKLEELGVEEKEILFYKKLILRLKEIERRANNGEQD